MTEDTVTKDADFMVQADSVHKNVLVNSINQGVAIVVGLLSSSLLVRAVDISWTTSDYAHLKVLMYWSGLLSIVIMMGLSTGIIKYVSELAHKREAMGTAIGISLVSVTLVYLAVAFISVFIGAQIGFLAGDTPEITMELRALWFLVLFALLPSAYQSIAASVFIGLQRMDRFLYINLLYNCTRGVILAALFFTNTITITAVLYLYLGTSMLGFVGSAFILRREARIEGISISVNGWREVSPPLFRVSSVILALALLSTYGTILAPLIVDRVGTDLELMRYAIAQRSIETLKSLVYAPFAIILPNMAGMRARGEEDRFRTRFEEAYRIIIPTLIFAFLAAFVFGPDLLGAIYGYKGIDITYGLSAAQYFMAMSPILLIVPLNTLYGQLILASDKMRIMLILGALSIGLQAFWTIIMVPQFGIIAIASWWISIIPVFICYHLYCMKSLKVHIRIAYLARALVVCVIFGGIMILSLFLAQAVVGWLSAVPLMSSTTIRSLAKLVFVIPLWYAFIGACLATGLMRVHDLENLKKFLKQIPPLWWVSRPLLRIVERVAARVKRYGSARGIKGV